MKLLGFCKLNVRLMFATDINMGYGAGALQKDSRNFRFVKDR
jgi:hypothetical protein